MLDAGAEVLRIEAHVIARQQHAGAIQRGVLHGLGGHRRGQLLEARERLGAQTPRTARRQCTQEGAAKPVVEMWQQGPVSFGQGLPRAVQCLLKEAPILLGTAAGLGVSAIHREVHDQLTQRSANGAEGQVAGGDVVTGDVQQTLGDFLQITGQRTFQHQAPCLLDFLLERCRPPALRLPQLAERQFAMRVVLQQRHLVHELVTGSAVHRPFLRQLFTSAENLLHEDREGRIAAQLPDASAQPAAIGTRVGQAVDVIDAQAVDQAALDQLEDLGVRLFEYLSMLDAQRTQFVDIEKPSPVYVVRCGTPAGDAVMLTFEQCMQPLLRRFVMALKAGQQGRHLERLRGQFDAQLIGP